VIYQSQAHNPFAAVHREAAQSSWQQITEKNETRVRSLMPTAYNTFRLLAITELKALCLQSTEICRC